ncbi:MAG: rod-binding protein [Treponema sp.]|jgi:flagellar protein FlgJ|nr:rod-binding protein [Treponema sp.]
MDISGIASSFIDSYQLSAMTASTAFTPSMAASGGSTDFSSILERAARIQNNQDDSAEKNDIDTTGKLYELCLELETFLVKNLLNSMRNSVQKTGLIDNSYAGKMYEDMLWDEYAKDFTKNASFGLAQQAYRQLTYS